LGGRRGHRRLPALLAAGYTVQVLEARERAGGRAHTDHSLGLPVDLAPPGCTAQDNAFTTPRAGSRVHRHPPRTELGRRRIDRNRSPSPAERERAGRDWARYQALIDAAAAAGRDVAVSELLPQDEYRSRFDAVATWAVGVESTASRRWTSRYAESENNCSDRGPWQRRGELRRIIAGDIARAGDGAPLGRSIGAACHARRNGACEGSHRHGAHVRAGRWRHPVRTAAACDLRSRIRSAAAGCREQGVPRGGCSATAVRRNDAADRHGCHEPHGQLYDPSRASR
jgi:hypothetical protein